MNNAAITSVYKFLFGHMFSLILGIHLGVEILAHGNSMFNLLKNCQFVFQWLHYFIFPPVVYEQWWFLHIIVNTYNLSFYFSHLCRSKVVPHCGFDLHFLNDQWYWTSFHCWPFVYLLGRKVYSSPLSIFKLSCLFVVEFWVLFKFWILNSYKMCDLQIFSPTL